MARARGTVYLYTDRAERDISRAVDGDLRVTYYPGSSTGDRPIIVRMAYRDSQAFPDTILVSVYQQEDDGSETLLWETKRSNKKTAPLYRANDEDTGAVIGAGETYDPVRVLADDYVRETTKRVEIYERQPDGQFWCREIVGGALGTTATYTEKGVDERD